MKGRRDARFGHRSYGCYRIVSMECLGPADASVINWNRNQRANIWLVVRSDGQIKNGLYHDFDYFITPQVKNFDSPQNAGCFLFSDERIWVCLEVVGIDPLGQHSAARKFVSVKWLCGTFARVCEVTVVSPKQQHWSSIFENVAGVVELIYVICHQGV